MVFNFSIFASVLLNADKELSCHSAWEEECLLDGQICSMLSVLTVETRLHFSLHPQCQRKSAQEAFAQFNSLTVNQSTALQRTANIWQHDFT